MTGIIFTGHGSFGSGLLSAVSLLAGESPLFIAVDFKGEDADGFLDSLQAGVDLLTRRGCHQILILCDLLGGTPFHTAASAFHDSGYITILYGVNLPFAVQLCLGVEETGITDQDLLSLVEESRETLGILTIPDSCDPHSDTL